MAWGKTTNFHSTRLLRAICTILLLLAVDVSVAQPFFFGNETPRTLTAGMLGYTAVDFKFDGDTPPVQPLSFDAPVYSLVYSKSNIYAAFAFGSQNAPDTSSYDLSFLDFTASFWGEVFFSEAATRAPHRIFLPIGFYFNYRKVAPRGIDVLEEFNITTIGLGLGLGYYGTFSENVLLEVRSLPVFGLAVRSFGDSAGTARLIDNDVQLHLGQVFNNIGISIGYHYRIMIWDVKTSNIFGNISQDLFNYREHGQTFSIGLNW